MTFTLSLPTWNTIKSLLGLVVLYYGALVAPQYDWYVFGIAYFFGILTFARTIYREWEIERGQGEAAYLVSLLWLFYIPTVLLFKFIHKYVTFMNTKKVIVKPDPKPEPSHYPDTDKYWVSSIHSIRKELINNSSSKTFDATYINENTRAFCNGDEKLLEEVKKAKEEGKRIFGVLDGSKHNILGVCSK